MPNKPCCLCGKPVQPGRCRPAGVRFQDGTTVYDVPVSDIIRLAPSTHQHTLKAPESDTLHPECKAALLEVKNARSAEPTKRYGLRSMEVEPAFTPAPPAERKRASAAEQAKALELEAEQWSTRRRRGQIELLDNDAVAELATFDDLDTAVAEERAALSVSAARFCCIFCFSP